MIFRRFACLALGALIAVTTALGGTVSTVSGPLPPQPADQSNGAIISLQIAASTALFVDPLWAGGTQGPCRLLTNQTGTQDQMVPIDSLGDWQSMIDPATAGQFAGGIIAQNICCRPSTPPLNSALMCNDGGTATAVTPINGSGTAAEGAGYGVLGSAGTAVATCVNPPYGDYSSTVNYTCGETGPVTSVTADGVWNEGGSNSDSCSANSYVRTGACGGASCGTGTQSVTTYNSCGQVTSSGSQACNTGVSCCVSDGSCSGGCNGGSGTDNCGNGCVNNTSCASAPSCSPTYCTASLSSECDDGSQCIGNTLEANGGWGPGTCSGDGSQCGFGHSGTRPESDGVDDCGNSCCVEVRPGNDCTDVGACTPNGSCNGQCGGGSGHDNCGNTCTNNNACACVSDGSCTNINCTTRQGQDNCFAVCNPSGAQLSAAGCSIVGVTCGSCNQSTGTKSCSDGSTQACALTLVATNSCSPYMGVCSNPVFSGLTCGQANDPGCPDEWANDACNPLFYGSKAVCTNTDTTGCTAYNCYQYE